MCDRHEEDAALLARGGERLGCYRDQAGHRVLRGFVRSSYTFIIMFIFCQLSKLPLHMFIFPDKFVSWHIATSQCSYFK